MIYAAPCICFGCVHIHYEGKWEGVGPWNSRVFWALWNGIVPFGAQKTRELRIKNYSSLLFILLSSSFPSFSCFVPRNLLVFISLLASFSIHTSHPPLPPPCLSSLLLNNLLPVYIIHGSQHRVHIFLEMKQGKCVCPLSWSVHCKFTGDGKCNKRGWACTPHPHQPGPILPSSLNVRHKAAVATLCTLWFTIC